MKLFNLFKSKPLEKEEQEAVEKVEKKFLELEQEWENKFAGKEFADLKSLLKEKNIDIELAYEQNDFQRLWDETTKLYRETHKLIKKGKARKHLKRILKELDKIKEDTRALEKVEMELREKLKGTDILEKNPSIKQEFDSKDQILEKLINECNELRKILQFLEMEG